jgi:hypothetical protein
MTKLMEAMGERILRRVLSNTEAGACVPEYGTQCKCEFDPNHYFCRTVGGKKYRTYYKKRWNFNCNGVASALHLTPNGWSGVDRT